MAEEPKYIVGQLVHHKLFDYRGVVYDIDEVFRGSDEWYELIARSRPPRDQPWYRVLVHEKGYETYVAEKNLEPDESGEEIEHERLYEIFRGMEDGYYIMNGEFH